MNRWKTKHDFNDVGDSTDMCYLLNRQSQVLKLNETFTFFSAAFGATFFFSSSFSSSEEDSSSDDEDSSFSFLAAAVSF